MENHHVEKCFIELNGPSSSSQTVVSGYLKIPAIDAFPSYKPWSSGISVVIFHSNDATSSQDALLHPAHVLETKGP